MFSAAEPLRSTADRARDLRRKEKYKMFRFFALVLPCLACAQAEAKRETYISPGVAHAAMLWPPGRLLASRVHGELLLKPDGFCFDPVVTLENHDQCTEFDEILDLNVRGQFEMGKHNVSTISVTTAGHTIIYSVPTQIVSELLNAKKLHDEGTAK